MMITSNFFQWIFDSEMFYRREVDPIWQSNEVGHDVDNADFLKVNKIFDGIWSPLLLLELLVQSRISVQDKLCRTFENGRRKLSSNVKNVIRLLSYQNKGEKSTSNGAAVDIHYNHQRPTNGIQFECVHKSTHVLPYTHVTVIANVFVHYSCEFQSLKARIDIHTIAELTWNCNVYLIRKLAKSVNVCESIVCNDVNT